MGVAENLERLRASLPEGVTLVAVSKFHDESAILDAYAAGQRNFAESRVQEFLPKYEHLPNDIAWHFIGHIQTNKVKSLIGKTDLIESVDSERLLDLIDDLSEQRGVITKVLLEVHVAAEEAKFGFSEAEVLQYFRAKRHNALKATHICGIMGMATNTDDLARVRADFDRLAALFHAIKAENPNLRGFDTLSMGMSHDYPLAIAAGATHVRIGTAIFGERK